MESPVSPRKPYPTDVSDDDRAFAAPSLTLMTEDAPQRRHELREVFNALRWIVHTGAPWRYLPGDFPPWEAVSRQTRRWLEAGVFEAMTHDLRELLRWAGWEPQPSAVVFDSATRQSTPESGHRAGYAGYKRKKGSKVHIAVDTLGHLLDLLVAPASDQDRAQVAALAEAAQEATGQAVEVGFVDQGDTGEQAEQDAAAHGIRWRSSRWRRPSAASSCCPAAGSWSAPSPGRAASAAWPKITNGCRKRLRGCISSPLPASCCIASSLLPARVHNTL